jgi:hypothetical protein
LFTPYYLSSCAFCHLFSVSTIDLHPRGQFPLQTARASLTNRSASDAASAPAPVRTTP